MSKWRVKENPAWGKMLDVVADDHDVAFFQREEDAKRCVDAVNEVEKLRKGLKAAQRELENCYDALKRHLRPNDRDRCLRVMSEIRAALAKEE